MRPVLIAIALSLATASTAAAEEPEAPERVMESITDFGGEIHLRGRWHHHVLAHFVLSQEDAHDAAEASYGIGYAPRQGMSFALLGGVGWYGGAFGPVVTVRKLMATRNMRWRMEFESSHRFAGGYANEGYYAFDYAVGGLHIANHGTDFGVGAHLGSGHGLLPFKFEMRHTIGVTDGMPGLTSAFFMTFDFR